VMLFPDPPFSPGPICQRNSIVLYALVRVRGSSSGVLRLYVTAVWSWKSSVTLCRLWLVCHQMLSRYRLQITDYRLAPSKWGAREEPTSAPWATIEEDTQDKQDTPMVSALQAAGWASLCILAAVSDDVPCLL
jgi:hypothetical protein